MCGLFGFQWTKKSPPIEKRVALAVALGIANDTRGGHSYGWWADKRIEKGLGDITPEVLRLARSNSVMAHTRYGTHGDKNVANAHPFTVSSGKNQLIGAHNGVLSQHTMLNAQYKRKFEVDSQHIFQHLVEGRELNTIEGYGTIEYLNPAAPERIYLCRLTTDGALAVVRGDWGVAWSSTSNHLEAALAAANMKFEALRIDDFVVHYVEKGVCYTTEKRLNLKPRDTFPELMGTRRGHYYDWSDTDFEGWEGSYGERRDIPVRDSQGNVIAGPGAVEEVSAETINIGDDDSLRAYEAELRYDMTKLDHAEFFKKYNSTKHDAVEELEELRMETAMEEGSDDPDLVNQACLKLAQ